MNSKIVAAIAIIIILGIALFFAWPAINPPKKESIENPDYVDPKAEDDAILDPGIDTTTMPIDWQNCENNKVAYQKDYCYKAQAEDTQSVESCRKISSLGEKNSCIRMVAVDTSNTAICNYLESAYTTNDNSHLKSLCIGDIAEDLADETVCGQIANTEWKQACIDRATNA
jgi:hypothetical protein